MPLLCVFAGRKALSLLSDHVNEARSGEVANRCERIDQRIDVVSIDRAEVSEAELFEENAGSEERLDALFPFSDDRRDTAAFCRSRVHDAANSGPKSIVKRIALN